MSKDELVKLLRLEGYMTYADRKEAADLIDQQAARMADLEALLVKANDAWRALSQPKKVDLGRKCFRCGHDAHLGDCVNLIPADAQSEQGDTN